MTAYQVTYQDPPGTDYMNKAQVTISNTLDMMARIYACIVPSLWNPRIGCPELADLGRNLEKIPGMTDACMKYMDLGISPETLQMMREVLKEYKDGKKEK